LRSWNRFVPILAGGTLLATLSLFQACGSGGGSTPNAVAATAPTLTTQPASVTINPGAATSFSVVAAGTAPLRYQWKLGANPIGTDAATFSIAAAQAADAGSYTVVVSNSAGSVTSSAATLTLNVAPAITAQPQNQSVVLGATATFSVTATGTAPLHYQWKKGGSSVGTDSATLSVAAAQLADAGSYSVTVSNMVSSVTSADATLSISTPPAIVSSPAAKTVASGTSATFSVTATGSGPLHYQWKKDGVAVGTDAASFTLASAQAADAGAYSVVVSNPIGSVTSATAALTVLPTGTITGKITNYATGAALAGATVADDLNAVLTGSDGSFSFPTATTSGRKLLRITATDFVGTTRILAVLQGQTARVDAALLPATAMVLADASAKTLTVTGSPAQVTLAANSLVTPAGAAPVFPVKANVTPVDPSSSPALMPGDYTTSDGKNIESYGAMAVTFVDNAGAKLNLGTGKTATLRIPVAAARQGTLPPSTVPAFSFDETTGRWVQEGTLTLGGTSPNYYYEGAVGHFSHWNADQIYSTSCVTGKVVDGTTLLPVAGARVESEGRTYLGTSMTYSAADGTFSIPVKANSTVILTASTPNALSQSESLSTGAVGTVCTALTPTLKLGSVMNGSSVKIRLTWGANPRDLDSHLLGPNFANPATSFHVYFSSKGSLTSSPYANLDVDDTSSFGPEVVTITRMTVGTYTYYVHHYSGSGTILSSPARVELTLNGSTSVFVPPQPPAGLTIGDDSRWTVFNLVVDAAGAVTVVPVNTYTAGIPYAAGEPKAPSKPEPEF
jgi:uncharacterized protein YfaP (DUF2135 family)